MKFIYLDESGTGDDPFAVMVGIIADSHRMRVTKDDWDDLLLFLSNEVGKEISEIHTRDFYSGNSPWRDLNGDERKQIISAIFNWLAERKHQVVFSSLDRSKYDQSYDEEHFSQDLKSLWQFIAFHITLSLQKHFQGSKRGGTNRTENAKNRFVLIFDHEHTEQKHFTQLILDPPDWSESYYDKVKNQSVLSQVVDIPHFVDSRHVGLIQLADFVAYFLRRYIEIASEPTDERYEGEYEFISECIGIVKSRLINSSAIYMKRGRCKTAEMFYQYAPDCIRDL